MMTRTKEKKISSKFPRTFTMPGPSRVSIAAASTCGHTHSLHFAALPLRSSWQRFHFHSTLLRFHCAPAGRGSIHVHIHRSSSAIPMSFTGASQLPRSPPQQACPHADPPSPPFPGVRSIVSEREGGWAVKVERRSDENQRSSIEEQS